MRNDEKNENEIMISSHKLPSPPSHDDHKEDDDQPSHDLPSSSSRLPSSPSIHLSDGKLMR